MKNITNFLLTTDARKIGILYLIFSLFFGFIGLILSVFIRFELSYYDPLIFKNNNTLYNAFITAHGLILIFFFFNAHIIR